MKFKLIFLSLFFSVFYSCSKEYSCENCLQFPQNHIVTFLDCGSSYFSSPAFVNTPYLGYCTIPYTGGNGLDFKDSDPVTSTGVSGLTATLSAGTLALGDSNLTYTISGTPIAVGDATFYIDFRGQSCSITLKVDSSSAIIVIPSKIRIATQKERCLVVLPNGTVKAWGDNAFGQLGDGTTIDSHTPVQVKNLSGISAVATGAYHSLALKNDGTVWAWGKNEFGQLGDGTETEIHTPKQVVNLAGIISIAGGYDYSLALKYDGTVWAWGSNLMGQLGDGTYIAKRTPVKVINLSGITAIAGGLNHCLALKNDGTVWAWGWNLNGTLGDGTNIPKRSTPLQINNLSGITAIAANGSNHSLALRNGSTVWVWGDNSHGQLGDGTSVYKDLPIQLGTLRGVTTIGVGEDHSFVVRKDGTIWAWGWNGVGQLGVSLAFSYHQLSPVKVDLLSEIIAIVGGNFHSLAQKNDGTIVTMGGNVFGQLGDGTNTVYRYTPTIVNGLK